MTSFDALPSGVITAALDVIRAGRGHRRGSKSDDDSLSGCDSGDRLRIRIIKASRAGYVESNTYIGLCCRSNIFERRLGPTPSP